VLPWIGWLTAVHHHTQFGLLPTHGLGNLIAGQALFYLQRLPDQITGPFVEVATVLQRSMALAVAANLWAAMAFAIVIWGWGRTILTPRRRLAGVIAFATLALLLVWPFTEAGRFLIPLVPMVLTGLTEGLAHVMGKSRISRPRTWAAMILLGVSIPYSTYAIINGRAKAQRQVHANFDAACEWIVSHAARPGPVLTRHPGEVFWQTGYPTVEPDSPDPDGIDRLINRLGVTYLLIDDERYVNAGLNPLKRYVMQYPGRVALTWGKSQGNMSIQVFEVIRSN
jgi:hypothetical protein